MTAASEYENGPSLGGAQEVYTVSALNEAARATLERHLGRVRVEGEISNIARPASGHIYFSLKDSNAQIRCAMFRGRTRTLAFKPDNGLSVVASGQVSLYAPRGDYQLIVDMLEAAGDGALRMRFEQLKRKLYEEGLFDEARKQALPAWPRQIGLITSPSGAAVRDIVTVLRRRCPMIPVIIYPTAVQGAVAVPEIEQAIARANARAECDVLIVGRGGGSLEDLWAFNEERVARAISHSVIPVVSAVGHEIDITIADLVADLRAATPSAAAELVSPDTNAVGRHLETMTSRLQGAIHNLLRARTRDLQQVSARLVSPQRQLEARFQRVDELSQRLAQACQTQLVLRRSRVDGLASRLGARSPLTLLARMQHQSTHLEQRLRSAMQQGLKTRRQTLEACLGVLRAVGPQATLERGYAIVTNAAGRLVRDAATLQAGATLTTRLAHGRVVSTVERSLPDSDDKPG